jgi:hypothetical protein
MTFGFALSTNLVARSSKSSRRRAWVAGLVLFTCCLLPLRPAWADAMTRAKAAYSRGDYIGVVRMLTPLALRGNANAQAFLGFMYENGYGAPQAYDAAADLYIDAAIRGNSFGQCMLGLMYDKGHGVERDVVLAYKWLNLAAARATRRERDYFLRLRNAVASKMSPAQIREGQRLALIWVLGRP